MKFKNQRITRRDFLRAAGAMGIGSALLPAVAWAQGDSTPAPATSAAGAEGQMGMPAVGRRKFGRTGVEVPMLALGGMFDIPNNQFMLRQAINHGVTYWDTAAGYGNGQSETGFGMFFEKNPAERKNIFLVTKASGGHNPDDMTRLLAQSLARMKTDHVDLYFMHGMDDIAHVDRPEIKAWAENAKKEGRIRFFGFSSHKNMESCLVGAAKLEWIDGMMIKYNYQNMDTPQMKAAMDACVAAGIGLTAMKTQGKGPGADSPLVPFIGRNFTPGQAKLKAVWANPQISSICSQMPNMNFLKQNSAAALDKTEWTESDRAALALHAVAARGGFCAGCAHHCEPSLGGDVPVSDVMRHLMYHRHYGAEVDARAMFRALPQDVRGRLAQHDYSAAERACPQRLPIGDLMRQAATLLA